MGAIIISLLLLIVEGQAIIYVPQNSESDFGQVKKIGCIAGECHAARFRLLIQVSNFTNNLTFGYWKWLEIGANILDGSLLHRRRHTLQYGVHGVDYVNNASKWTVLFHFQALRFHS